MQQTRHTYDEIREVLGEEASNLLDFSTPAIHQESLHLPGPDFIDRVWEESDRSDMVKRNLARLFDHGRLGGTGYLSILPVDQGIEHSAGSAFAANPMYFDPANIVRLAVEGGCNAVASTLGILGSVAKQYSGEIPFILKINHNELLSYPNTHDQTMYALVDQAADMGAAAVGATIYFGSAESRRQIWEVSQAFRRAHQLGLATILWCYVRNDAFQQPDANYERAADLTAQANYLGATIEADIVKQKLPERNGGYPAVSKATGTKFGKFDERMYTELSSDHPIDLARYQVIHGFAGRVGLISSGGEATGDDNDFQDAVRSAVINKRAGGMGLILGRKAFERPFEEGVEILHWVQDVYLNEEVTVA